MPNPAPTGAARFADIDTAAGFADVRLSGARFFDDWAAPRDDRFARLAAEQEGQPWNA